MRERRVMIDERADKNLKKRKKKISDDADVLYFAVAMRRFCTVGFMGGTNKSFLKKKIMKIKGMK